MANNNKTFELKSVTFNYDYNNGTYEKDERTRKYALPSSVVDCEQWTNAIQLRKNTLMIRDAVEKTKEAKTAMEKTKVTSVAYAGRKASYEALLNDLANVTNWVNDNGGHTADLTIPFDLYSLVLFAIDNKSHKVGKATVNFNGAYHIVGQIIDLANGEAKLADVKKTVSEHFNAVGQTADEACKQWEYRITDIMLTNVVDFIKGRHAELNWGAKVTTKDATWNKIYSQLLTQVFIKAFKLNVATKDNGDVYLLSINK